MTWSTRFRVSESVRGSLWLLPLIGAVLGTLLAVGTNQVEHAVEVPSYWTYSA